MRAACWLAAVTWLAAACAPPALRLQAAQVAAHGTAAADIEVKARLRWTGGTHTPLVWEKLGETLPAGWGPPSVCTPAGCLGPGFATGKFKVRSRRWHEIYLTFYPEGTPGTATTRLRVFPAGRPERAVTLLYSAHAGPPAP